MNAARDGKSIAEPLAGSTMRIANFLLLSVSSAVVAAAVVSGCSDPEPVLPRGGYQASLGKAADVNCPIPAHNGQVGLVSATERENLAVAGVNNATVQCEVIGESSFKVVGTAAQGENSLPISIPKIDSGARADNPAKGNVGFASSPTRGEQFKNEGTQCDFFFQEETPQGVKAGEIWVAFKCPEVVLDGVDRCAITQGYAAFDGCTTGDE